MKAELTSQESAILEKYRFAAELPKREDQTDFATFLKEPSLISFLQELKNQLGAPDLQTTASIMMKRQAFLAVIYLYSLTAFNKRLLVAPQNVILSNTFKDGQWLPEYYFLSKEASICPRENRAQWRTEAIRHLFVDNLFPVMTAISNAVKIPKLILWENIAIYIYWLYEKVLAEVDEEDVKERAADDFAFLLNAAPGHIFGSYNHNPLTRYYNEPVFQVQTESYVRVRKTCCFSYRLMDGGYCKTCPRVCKQPNKGSVING